MPPGRPTISSDEKSVSEYRQRLDFPTSSDSLALNSAAESLILLIFGSTNLADESTETDSIYARLKKFFGETGPKLEPNPELNSSLSLLVAYLQGKTAVDLGKFFFAHIQQAACARIDKSTILTERACEIRQVACEAESSLENYYAKILLNADDALLDFPTDFSYVARIKHAAKVFPYINNYVEMVEVESTLLRKLLKSPYQNQSIIFCGSGPLPLTGLLFAATLGCSVTLVDNDATAIKLSRSLIRLWEDRHVLPRGLVKVMLEDCATLPLSAGNGSVNEENFCSEGKNEVHCDLLFLAALVPNEAKEALAMKAASLGKNCPVFAVRSAHGLTARLAYFHLKKQAFTQFGLRHKGTLAPCTHDFGNGEIVDGEDKPLSFFPSSILNSLEVYDGCAM